MGHQVQVPEVIVFRRARVLRADRDPRLGGDGVSAAVGSEGRSVVAWIEKFLVGSIRSAGSLVRDRVLLEGKGTEAHRKQIAGSFPVVRFGNSLPSRHLRVARGLQSGQTIQQQGVHLLRRQRVAAARKESFVLTIAWILTNGMPSCSTHVSSKDISTWCSASAIVS